MQLTQTEKRMVVAMVAKVGVLIMMNTHVYSWNGEKYLQRARGPIGLRSTCAVARIVMNEWDARWQAMCADNNIKLAKGSRYMDDQGLPQGPEDGLEMEEWKPVLQEVLGRRG